MSTESRTKFWELLRSKKPYDYKTLANLVGMQPTSINSIATRDKNPSAEIANKIIAAYRAKGVDLRLEEIIGPAN